MLLPAFNLEDYKDTLPGTERQMRHSTRLPRYDNSMLDKAHTHPMTQIAGRTLGDRRRKRRNYGNWTLRVAQALQERGPLSAEQIQDIIGCPGGPNNAMNLIIHSPLRRRLVRVGNAPRRVAKGPAPGLFALRETIKFDDDDFIEQKFSQFHCAQQQEQANG